MYSYDCPRLVYVVVNHFCSVGVGVKFCRMAKCRIVTSLLQRDLRRAYVGSVRPPHQQK